MVAIAIFSADPILRRSLEQLLREDRAITVVGVADDPSAMLRLIDQDHVDAVLADAPPREQLADWRIQYDRTAFVVLVDGADEENGLDALYAGARAILPRSAERDEIVVAIKAVTTGLAILPRELLPTLLNGASLADRSLDGNDSGRARLIITPRELEVLAAMADGASNKAIARRLGISYHTAKFHVAAILAKLDADSRTEAVTRAAQLGLGNALNEEGSSRFARTFYVLGLGALVHTYRVFSALSFSGGDWLSSCSQRASGPGRQIRRHGARPSRPGQSVASFRRCALSARTCPYGKSNPDVLMVQSAQDRQAENVANRLNTARNRRILAQR
jgi:two-component system nitrate/nitrite response regulator NarL